MTPRELFKENPQQLRLYAVTDTSWLEGRTLVECVQQALDGGTTFVQLRDKHATTNQLVEQARTLMTVCHDAGVPFVINDDVEAAVLAHADGVHVGQSDAACSTARGMLGNDKIIGVSVQTVEQAIQAQRDGADYVGVGALFATATKLDAADVSLDTLRAICAQIDIPVVGIGGLHMQTVPALQGTGVDGIAVVSALFAAPDITQAALDLRKAIDGIIEEDI